MLKENEKNHKVINIYNQSSNAPSFWPKNIKKLERQSFSHNLDWTSLYADICDKKVLKRQYPDLLHYFHEITALSFTKEHPKT